MRDAEARRRLRNFHEAHACGVVLAAVVCGDVVAAVFLCHSHGLAAELLEPVFVAVADDPADEGVTT